MSKESKAAEDKAAAEKMEADEKLADAKLRAAETLLSAGKPDAYRKALTEIVDSYPNTKAAATAKQKMKQPVVTTSLALRVGMMRAAAFFCGQATSATDRCRATASSTNRSA